MPTRRPRARRMKSTPRHDTWRSSSASMTVPASSGCITTSPSVVASMTHHGVGNLHLATRGLRHYIAGSAAKQPRFSRNRNRRKPAAHSGFAETCSATATSMWTAPATPLRCAVCGARHPVMRSAARSGEAGAPLAAQTREADVAREMLVAEDKRVFRGGIGRRAHWCFQNCSVTPQQARAGDGSGIKGGSQHEAASSSCSALDGSLPAPREMRRTGLTAAGGDLCP
jgi:hypothetical protein